MKVLLVLLKLIYGFTFSVNLLQVDNSLKIKNYSALALIVVLILVFTIIILRKSKKSKQEYEYYNNEYKKLIDHYKIIFNGIPFGIIIYNQSGVIEELNAYSKALITKILKTTPNELNFQKPNIFLNKENISKINESNNFEKKIVLKTKSSNRYIQIKIEKLINEESVYYLLFIIDKTQSVNEDSEASNILKIFDKASVESKIGVARLNLFDNSGFAMPSWYKNFNCTATTNVLQSINQIKTQDNSNPIIDYLEQVKQIQFNEEKYLQFVEANYQKTLSCNIQIVNKDNSINNLIIYGQVSNFNPDNGEVIVELISLNIDKQIQKEQELEQTYHKTLEAEKLKQSFIVNMNTEIVHPLHSIISLTKQVLNTQGQNIEEEIFNNIESESEHLLSIISKAIGKTVVGSELATAATTSGGATGGAAATGKMEEKTLAQDIAKQDSKVKTNAPLNKKLTILIAEHNENNFSLLSYMIANQHTIIRAVDGLNALQLYSAHKPDMIIVDLNLPVIDGTHTALQIRKTDNTTPIIAIIPFYKISTKHKLLENGFNDYIKKPINESEFLGIINKYAR